ncbi:uncharacterized protein MONBRDRAFT_7664 [Monosiga brevicollis MX1]|uniref:Uncharacterized protein n=1 Tax=Monosiga brevicollis TaxID=81824 RepID=A9UXY3_MONBE|nr:uncharacterized protein MONBRDRAFT_7664 [Monosiga brevicollis MX1]EDQ89766.1 predicted protein [Monosiga brevicollis MX1]|eukprot:XP_001745188.1 hypothetical protein [Monosiga brevicollis MX1]
MADKNQERTTAAADEIKASAEQEPVPQDNAEPRAESQTGEPGEEEDFGFSVDDLAEDLAAGNAKPMLAVDLGAVALESSTDPAAEPVTRVFEATTPSDSSADGSDEPVQAAGGIEEAQSDDTPISADALPPAQIGHEAADTTAEASGELSSKPADAVSNTSNTSNTSDTSKTSSKAASEACLGGDDASTPEPAAEPSPVADAAANDEEPVERAVEDIAEKDGEPTEKTDASPSESSAPCAAASSPASVDEEELQDEVTAEEPRAATQTLSASASTGGSEDDKPRRFRLFRRARSSSNVKDEGGPRKGLIGRLFRQKSSTACEPSSSSSGAVSELKVAGPVLSSAATTEVVNVGFRAKDLTMGDEDRAALMSEVRTGDRTQDQVVDIVLAHQSVVAAALAYHTEQQETPTLSDSMRRRSASQNSQGEASEAEPETVPDDDAANNEDGAAAADAEETNARRQRLQTVGPTAREILARQRLDTSDRALVLSIAKEKTLPKLRLQQVGETDTDGGPSDANPDAAPAPAPKPSGKDRVPPPVG